MRQTPSLKPAARPGAPGEAAPPGRRPHVLLVTPYYWPIVCAATHLMKDLAEGLEEGGYRVTVLSNRPGPDARPGPGGTAFQGRVHRAWNPFLRRMGALAKMGEYLWFLAFFFVRGLAVPRVDLLFVVSNPPLAGLPGALLAWLKGAKLVYNLQDIFPDSAVVAGMLPASGWAYRLLRRAERASYRVSHLVATISPAFSTYVQQAAPGTPVATIPNWVDTEEVRPMADQDPALAAYRCGGAFVVQYAGNMGFVQNLETVLRAAERLKGDAGIRFVFIGDGNAKKGLEEQAGARGMANCDFLPMQPLDRVPLVYNACDLGVIPLKPGAAEIAVPSKTWNYLAAARPVLCCVEEGTSLARVIQDSGSGSVVPPEDSEALARTILAYRDAPDRVRAEGARGRAHVEAHLSRRAALQSYLRVLDGLLDRPDLGRSAGRDR